MAIYFKLTNHGQAAAYYQYPHGAMPHLDLPGHTWTASGQQTVAAPNLQAGDLIVLFQNIHGICQVVTHIVEVTGPAARDANLPANVKYPHRVPVKVLSQLDASAFGGTRVPAVAGWTAGEVAPIRKPNIGLAGGGLRLGHLVGAGSVTVDGIASGSVRASHNGYTVTATALSTWITAHHGYR
jgi:hypothetical protein